MNGMFTEMHERFPAVKDDFSQRHSTAIDILGVDKYIEIIEKKPGSCLKVRIPKALPKAYKERYIKNNQEKTVKEIAENLCVHRDSVYRLRKNNDRLQTKPE